jgi:glycosyltransferase involved in cell wall biosynthesis
VVVTVHDVIPYLLRNDPCLCTYRTPADRLFDRLALAGLRRADWLFADSEYTKRCLVAELGLRPQTIEVVYLGVEHERFRPLAASPAVRERYGLPEGRRYLIYVGSEDPRKNLPTLIRALALVRARLPELELIKVGRAHFVQERRRLLALAQQTGVREAIHFLDDVPEQDLPLLYNLADACVLPSLYEGFGFPVLEAMACGTPVVCSNATSLPEVAGDAAVLVDCTGGGGELAAALYRVLSDSALRFALGGKGLARAARFRWSNTARLAVGAYRRITDEGSVPSLANGAGGKSAFDRATA